LASSGLPPSSASFSRRRQKSHDFLNFEPVNPPPEF
jgi:hypothetical protein